MQTTALGTSMPAHYQIFAVHTIGGGIINRPACCIMHGGKWVIIGGEEEKWVILGEVK